MTAARPNDLRARQHSLDLAIPREAMLVKIEVVEFVLQRDIEDVAMLIHDRYLRYAFDIRTLRTDDGQPVKRSEPRVLGASVLNYQKLSGAGDYRTLLKDAFPSAPRDAQKFADDTRRVIASLLPHRKLTLKMPELCRALSCTKEHINNLCGDGLLIVSKTSTCNTAAEFTRASVIDFLIARRMPFTP